MNTHSLPLVALLLAAMGSPFAQSATTDILNISGTIEPAACNVKVRQQADFGTLKRAALTSIGGKIDLSPQTATFDIDCDGKTSTNLSFKATTLAKSSVTPKAASTPSQAGGLMDAQGSEIGSFSLLIKAINVDGASATPLTRAAGTKGAFSTLPLTTALKLDNTQSISWGKGATPQAAKSVTGTLAVEASLDENLLAQNGDKTQFKGSAVLTLSYN